MSLRAMARRVLMAKVKISTGNSDTAAASSNAREALVDSYEKTLNDLTRIPVGDPYRESVEAYVGHRLRIVRQERDWEAIERRIGAGQIEELLAEARWQHHQILGVLAAEPWVRDSWIEFANQHEISSFLWDTNPKRD